MLGQSLVRARSKVRDLDDVRWRSGLNQVKYLVSIIKSGGSVGLQSKYLTDISVDRSKNKIQVQDVRISKLWGSGWVNSKVQNVCI